MGIFNNIKLAGRVNKTIKPLFKDLTSEELPSQFFDFLFDMERMFDSEIESMEKLYQVVRKDEERIENGLKLGKNFNPVAMEIAFLMHFIVKDAIDNSGEFEGDRKNLYTVLIDVWLCSQAKKYVPELASLQSKDMFVKVADLYGQRKEFLYDQMDIIPAVLVMFIQPLSKNVPRTLLQAMTYENNTPKILAEAHATIVSDVLDFYGKIKGRWK